MLKFQRPSSKNATDSPTLSRRSLPDRRCSFVSSQLGYSRAVVVIRRISVPLAWPVEEYFSGRRDWREFSVQLVFRASNGKEYFSKPIEKINPTFTDVNFPDEFVIPNQGNDFIIELTVYCKRTDKATISRSLGKSLGQSWKKYAQQHHEQQQRREIASTNGPNKSFLEMLRRAGEEEEKRRSLGLPPLSLDAHMSADGGEQQQGQMSAVGNAHFRLQNASLSGRVHNYAMDKLPAIARQELLPIYGSICAQILVQPCSLVSPLAQGSLEIFLPDKGVLLQRLRCSLQGGQLKCWEMEANPADTLATSQGSNWSLLTLSPGKVPILTVSINESTRVEKTAFPTAFRLIANVVPEQANLVNILCLCATRSALLGWRNALQLQLMDCSVWSDFALRSRNPHGAALGPLADAGPSSFQSLIGMEAEDNEEKIDLPKPKKTSDENTDKMPNLNSEQRPRNNSSASMFMRNGTLKLMDNEWNDFVPKNGFAIAHQKTFSRTTLLDTTGQLAMSTDDTLADVRMSAPATPSLSIIRRKTNQSADESNNNRSPSILRRFSPRPKQQQNISWFVREQDYNSAAASDFPLNNSLNLSEASFAPPIIEEEREETDKSDKNKHENTGGEHQKEQPNYVISLQISANSKSDGLKNKSLNSSHKISRSDGTMPTENGTSASATAPNKFIHRIKQSVNGSTKSSTEILQKTIRPFHVSDLSQTPARWTRAHIGRAETWHFARIGEACTRL